MKAKRTGDPAPIASRRRAEQLGVADLFELAIEAALYLETEPHRAGAEHLRRVIKAARLALAALDQGEAIGAAVMAMQAMQHAWLAEIAEGRPMIDAGVKAVRGAAKGNESKTKAAKPAHDEWQRQAEVMWGINPALSVRAVADRIDPDRGDYIRRHIKKPVKR